MKQIMKLNNLHILSCILFSLFAISGALSIVPVYGQVQPEVDIQTGASSGKDSPCMTDSNCLSPNPIHVTPGTTVSWKNADYVNHTITSVNNLCNGPHMTIQIATDAKSVDPTVMIRTSLTGITYAQLAQNQPYAEENAHADVRRLVYEAYVSPVSKSFEVVVMEGIGRNTYSVQKEVQVPGCDVGSVFDSGVISPNDTFKFTFETVGNYNYFCTIHPWLMGQVIVEGYAFDKSSNSQSNVANMTIGSPSIIPEFQFAIPIMLIGIISAIVFYNIKFRQY